MFTNRKPLAPMPALLIATTIANWAVAACVYLAIRSHLAPTRAEIQIEHVQHFRLDTHTALVRIQVDRPAHTDGKEQAQTTELVFTPRAVLEMRHGINLLVEAVEQKAYGRGTTSSVPPVRK